MTDPEIHEPAAPSLVEVIARTESELSSWEGDFDREDVRALIAAAKETVLLRAQLAPSHEPTPPNLVESIARAERCLARPLVPFPDPAVDRESLRALIAAAKETVLLRAQLAAAKQETADVSATLDQIHHALDLMGVPRFGK